MPSRIETLAVQLLAEKRITADEAMAIVAVVMTVADELHKPECNVKWVAGQIGYRAMSTLETLSKEE